MMRFSLLLLFSMMGCSSEAVRHERRDVSDGSTVHLGTATEEPKSITAVRGYLKAVEAADYGLLYERCFHSEAKQKVSRGAFEKTMKDGFSETLRRLCIEILDAYAQGGLTDGTLTVKEKRWSMVEKTIVVELPRKPQQQKGGVLPPGKAMRIQIAPDPEELKFYDID